MKKVVAIGELLIDFVPQQRGCALDEVVQFERVAGGAPANVATAVARLGGRAQMISQVGEDAFGTHILKTLHANGVNISTVFRTGRANTALAFVSLDKNGNREFSFYRNPSADLFLDEAQITPDIFADCAVLHFCSVDLVDAPVKQAHRKAIRLTKDAGAFLSFDPNVRLPLWGSPESCQAAIREFLPYADLVNCRMMKLNSAPAAKTAGKRQSFCFRGAAGCCLHAARAAAVYAERERRDQSAGDGRGYHRAGDSFIGSFLYPVTRDGVTAETLADIPQKKLADYLTFSSECSAYTVQHKGRGYANGRRLENGKWRMNVPSTGRQ